MRHGSVAALAAHRDSELVIGRQHRARREGECPAGDARHIVHAKHSLYGKLLKQSFLDHFTGADCLLFSRLENKVDGRSEENTSEIQSLMRNSYSVLCLKKK